MCALHTCARLGSRKKWHRGASINDVCKISCINWIPSPPLSAFHTTCKMRLSAKSAFPQPPPRSAVQTSFMDCSPCDAMFGVCNEVSVCKMPVSLAVSVGRSASTSSRLSLHEFPLKPNAHSRGLGLSVSPSSVCSSSEL